MSDGRKAAAEAEEDEFWASAEGKKLLLEIKASNDLRPEWNALCLSIGSVPLGTVTVAEFRFLDGCCGVQKASMFSRDRAKFVDPEKMAKLKELLGRGALMDGSRKMDRLVAKVGNQEVLTEKPKLSVKLTVSKTTNYSFSVDWDQIINALRVAHPELGIPVHLEAEPDGDGYCTGATIRWKKEDVTHG